MTTMSSTLRRLFRNSALPLAATALLVQACSPPSQDAEQPAASQGQSLRQDPHISSASSRITDHLMSLRKDLGLDANHGFAARGSFTDEFNRTHLRFDQTYLGVRVWEADGIVEVGTNNSPQNLIHDFKGGIDVNTVPTLSASDARSIAHSDLRPRGEYASEPTAELIIYPETSAHERANRLRGVGGELNAEDIEHVVERYTLAYYVHTALENGKAETRHTDFIINAHSGEIIKKWDALKTTAATGSGSSEYSGTVSLGTNTISGGWELHDIVRGMNITTYNLNHGTSGTGTVYSDTDNVWGDGKNYTSGGSTTAANGETAGVDAHFGTEKTFDYYSNVHSRNGIDGAGKATYNRVHYSSAYDNAFWDDTCFCMTYGDGSAFTVLTSLDVAGHEMSHGVTANTAKLTYSGEPGGLNESMSDISGTMVEFYARGGSGSTIGNTGGNWLIGDQLSATPLRYMYKPSKDGASKDAWSSTLGGLDVHYSSGPMNRAFYFLSQGASNVSTSDYYSTYLPGGMTGIGNDEAARIEYRALSTKMTSSTNYAAARTAFLAAATDLYGATSAEYAAVENAFGAINVGKPHMGSDTTPPTTSLTAPTAGSTLTGTVTVSANAMDNVAVTKVEFYAGATLIGTDTTSPYSISWNSATVANGTYSLTSKAYDAAANVGTSAAVSVTVSNMVTDTTPPTTSLTAPTAGSTLSGTVTVSANAMDNVAVTKVEFYAGATLLGTSTTAPYSISWNTTTVANGSYSLTSKAYDAAANVGTSAAVSVTVNNMVSDTVPPTTKITAPTAGSTLSGTVSVTADATDNVGVTKVEFYAGATLLGTSTTAPYSVSWNTTTVANGTYSLTTKAYDAAANVGTSAAVSVTVNNMGGSCTSSSQLLTNPGFESGNTGWTTTSGVIDNTYPANAHAGSWVAWLDGYGTTHTDTMYQQVTIPAAACSAKFSFWLAIQTNEFDSSIYDKLTVTVQDTTGKVLGTLATYSNADASGYVQHSFDLSAYKGQTVRLNFKGTEDAFLATNFLIDDTALTITQ